MDKKYLSEEHGCEDTSRWRLTVVVAQMLAVSSWRFLKQNWFAPILCAASGLFSAMYLRQDLHNPENWKPFAIAWLIYGVILFVMVVKTRKYLKTNNLRGILNIILSAALLAFGSGVALDLMPKMSSIKMQQLPAVFFMFDLAIILLFFVFDDFLRQD